MKIFWIHIRIKVQKLYFDYKIHIKFVFSEIYQKWHKNVREYTQLVDKSPIYQGYMNKQLNIHLFLKMDFELNLIIRVFNLLDILMFNI